MTKLSAFFISIVLAAPCNVAAKAELASGDSPSATSNPSDFNLNKVLDLTSSLLKTIKNMKVSVEPLTPAKPDMRLYPMVKALIIPNEQQAASKHRTAKMFEMGMYVPLSQKFSWGAEVAVSKYKNNLTPDPPQKRPLAGLRLKPDLYTVQISLKYKI